MLAFHVDGDPPFQLASGRNQPLDGVPGNPAARFVDMDACLASL